MNKKEKATYLYINFSITPNEGKVLPKHTETHVIPRGERLAFKGVVNAKNIGEHAHVRSYRQPVLTGRDVADMLDEATQYLGSHPDLTSVIFIPELPPGTCIDLKYTKGPEDGRVSGTMTITSTDGTIISSNGLTPETSGSLQAWKDSSDGSALSINLEYRQPIPAYGIPRGG